jgi:DNA helicase HerA-like ATPase
VTQNPLDIPDTVLGQLGNRVQHALRAFTPRDQKAVKSAAETMRPNPKLKIEQAISELGVGEALVSLLDEKGRPNVTERAFIVPPASQLGPVTPEQRKKIIASSTVYGHYEQTVDRESAFEKLKARVEKKPEVSNALKPRQSVYDAAVKSAVRAIGSELGRQVIRGVLGSILGKRR